MSLPLRLLPVSEDSAASFQGMVGRHPNMLALYDDIRHAAPQRAPLVIEGPTGSGKELVARAVHELSGCKGSLVAVNLGEIAEQLVESELYGAVKGAYTGAVADRRGLIEAAAHGTLFLDEAGDLPLSLQSKLLRVLETECIRRVGGTTETATAFRLVVSIQRPASELAADGRWRTDFYYRVAGLRLKVPALADRRSDIPLLAKHFVRGLEATMPSDYDLDALQTHDWPGNVRELRRVVERALHSARGRPLRGEDLCAAIEIIQPARALDVLSERPLRESLQEAERRHIEQVLTRTNGDWRAATALLGVSKSTFYRRLEALGLRIGSPRRSRRET
jgi:two-component system, NtrC family, response regulator HydG